MNSHRQSLRTLFMMRYCPVAPESDSGRAMASLGDTYTVTTAEGRICAYINGRISAYFLTLAHSVHLGQQELVCES